MRRARDVRPFVLALALVALFAERARAQAPASLDEVKLHLVIDKNTPLEVTQFLGLWGNELKVAIVYDQTVKGTRINFLTAETDLTWGMAKKILDFNDIVIEEKESPPYSGRWVMFVHQRRSIATKLPPPFKYIDLRKDSLPKREEVVTAVVQIIHGAGADIYSNIRGLLTRDVNRIGNILYVRGPEVFIIVDFASSVEYYVKIIKALDVPAPGQEIRIKQITYAPAGELAQLLSAILRATGGIPGQPGGPMPVIPSPGGPGGQGQPQVIADPRTNKVIIQAFSYQFEEIDRLLGELDIKVSKKLGRFHVYHCHDTDAQYLSGKVKELFSGQSAGGARGGKKPGQAGATGPAVIQPGQLGGGLAGQGQATDVNRIETRIVADELTNSLLIQADEETWGQIESLLTQLDQRRRVVAIEAQVWEISTPTDQLTIGVELAAISNPAKGKFRGAGLSDFGLSSINFDQQNQKITRLPTLQQGLISVISKDSFDKLPVIVEAVANFSRAKLITKPFAVTNDNEEADFAIDNQVQFPVSQPTTGGVVTTSLQPIDAKSELKITPQVNSEDNLTLTVSLTLTSFGPPAATGAPPSTNARTYTGTVTIPNQKFVVFGGLESESESKTETKIPFVGDIPILGHLFKNVTYSKQKSQVYIFIRPTIFADKKSHVNVSRELLEISHVAAEREEWVPPIISEAATRGGSKGIQDEAFETFGTGSGNPFGTSPKDE